MIKMVAYVEVSNELAGIEIARTALRHKAAQEALALGFGLGDESQGPSDQPGTIVVCWELIPASHPR